MRKVYVLIFLCLSGFVANAQYTASRTTCSNQAFTYQDAITFPGGNYSWTNPTSPDPFTGGSASTPGAHASVSQTLVNPGTAPITVTYNVTELVSGGTITLTVTVNPTPTVNTGTTQDIIAGGSTTAIGFAATVGGTVFNWTNNNIAIGYAVASGSGNIPVFTGVNTGTTVATANFQVTPAANGCNGTARTFTVNVHPTNVVNCSNIALNYSNTTVFPAGNYVWALPVVTGGITGRTSSAGSPAIPDVLVNPTNAPQTATYSVNETVSGISFTLVVTVNPTPTVDALSAQSQAICDGTLTTPVTFTSAFNVAGTQFNWVNNTPSINLAGSGTSNSIPAFTAANVTAVPVTATITVTPMSNSCSGTPQAFTIVVNPTPALTSGLTPFGATGICNFSTFTYTATSATTGVTFAWLKPAVAGISSSVYLTGTSPNTPGATVTTESFSNTTTSALTVSYVFSLVTSNGCSNTQTVGVLVNPTPGLSSTVTPLSVCSATTFNYTPTSLTSPAIFTWSTPVTTGISASGALTGTGNISQFLTNTTTSPSVAPVTASYYYTVSTNGCANPSVFTVTFAVNPTPSLAGTLTPASICSSNTFNYTALSTTNLTTTSYAWSRAPIVGITGSSTGATAIVSEPLFSTNTTATTVVYNFTLTAYGCVNNQNVSVDVNPTPLLSSTTTPTPICSGTLFSYSPTSPVTANFGWVRNTVSGISTAPRSASNDPAEILTNITTLPVDVPYLYTLTSPSGCGSAQVVTVTVDPTPTLTTPLTPTAICTGATFSYTAASGTPGTVFSYYRPLSAVITNAPITVTGSGTISEALINPTLASGSAIYTFTLTANGCNNIQTVTETVNPVPLISPITTSSCANAVFSITPGSVPAGTTYTWPAALVAPAGSIPTGNNNQFTPTSSINAVLTNNTINAATATYTVTPTAGSCAGTTFTVTLNLDPTPSIGTQTLAAICSGTTFNFSATAGTVPVTTAYTWSAAITPTSSLAGANNNTVSLPSVSATLTTTGNQVGTAIYTVVPATATCTGAAFTLTVPVNPQPIVTGTVVPVCSGAFFNFTPSSNISGTTYTWPTPVDPAGAVSGQAAGVFPAANISQQLFNSTAATAQVYYNVIPSVGICAGSSFTVTANVNRLIPSFGVQSSTICNGTAFNATPSAPAGTTFTWTLPTVSTAGTVTGFSAALVPQTSVSQVLTNSPTANSINTVTYTVTPIINTCAGPVFTATIDVNPTAVITSPLSLSTVCNNTVFSYTPGTSVITPVTYAWSLAPATGITSSGSSSGTGSIPTQTLTNSTNAPVAVAYSYNIATNGCANSHVYTVTFTVNPSAVLTNNPLTPSGICTGSPFTYTASSSTIFTPTTYSWTRAASASISSPGPASGSTQAINEVLNNGTAAPATIDFVYLLTAYGCSNAQTVTVSVDPIPVLTSSTLPAPICSGNTFNYSPTNTVPGTAYNWVRTTVNGISNPAASGTGNPLEVLANSTVVPLTVTYTYTLITTGGCSNSQAFTLTVNPIPVLSSSLTPTSVCNGAQFTYNATSLTPGATFNWARPVTPPVTNGAAVGAGNVSEFLVNPTITPAAVTYSYTTSANGCSNNQLVTVSVNPVPVVPAQSTASCSNIAFSIVPANQPTATLYTWPTPTVTPSGALLGANLQPTGISFIGQSLNNQTVSQATAVYTVTPVASGCTGVAFTVTVTINPMPFVASQIITAICSNTPFSYVASFVPTATTYTWGNPALSPTGGLTGAGAQPVSQPAVSQTLINNRLTTDTAFYSVVPATAFCVGQAFSLTVPVKPLPSIADQRDTICSGTAFFITPSSGLNNTTFTWTAPVSTPSGSISGGSAQTLAVSSISQVLTNLTTATAQTVYTITPNANNCAGPTFTLIETVVRPVPAFGNIPATICSGTAFDATPPTAPSGTTYTWTIPVTNPTGGVTGVSAASTRQTVVSQTLGNVLNVVDTVTYTVLPFLNGCQGPSFTATVRVQPVVKGVVSGLTSICQNPLPDTVSVRFTGTAPWSFTYSDGISTATKTGITTSPYSLVLPVYPKTATSRTISVTNVKDFACLNTTDTFTLTQKINALPVGTIVSLHGKYLCNGVTDTLLVQTTDSVGYQWKLNNSAITAATTNAIATSSAGVYNVTLTNRYNCVDTAAIPYILTFVQQPVLKFKIDTSCIFSQTHFYNLTDTSATGTISWLWKFGNGKTDTAMTGRTTYTAGGKYHVSLTATQLFCTNYPPTTKDSTIDVGSPIPGVTLPSVSTYKMTLTPVEARTFANYKYLWTPSSGIQAPDSASTNFQQDTSQLYLIKLISPLNCVTTDTMMVRVFDDQTVQIFVPKSFTPNGDGVNDILYPYLAGIKTFHFFRVLNRYGKLLFETRDPDKGWNGMFNGGAQPMSVYFWVAEGTAADGSIVQKAGQVLLMR